MDEAGKLVAKRRISDDAEGYLRLLELLAEAGDSAADPIPVAVETARGLLVSCLRTTGAGCTRSTRWRWLGIGSAGA